MPRLQRRGARLARGAEARRERRASGAPARTPPHAAPSRGRAARPPPPPRTSLGQRRRVARASRPAVGDRRVERQPHGARPQAQQAARAPRASRPPARPGTTGTPASRARTKLPRLNGRTPLVAAARALREDDHAGAAAGCARPRASRLRRARNALPAVDADVAAQVEVRAEDGHEVQRALVDDAEVHRQVAEQDRDVEGARVVGGVDGAGPAGTFSAPRPSPRTPQQPQQRRGPRPAPGGGRSGRCGRPARAAIDGQAEGHGAAERPAARTSRNLSTAAYSALAAGRSGGRPGGGAGSGAGRRACAARTRRLGGRRRSAPGAAGRIGARPPRPPRSSRRSPSRRSGRAGPARCAGRAGRPARLRRRVLDGRRLRPAAEDHLARGGLQHAGDADLDRPAQRLAWPGPPPPWCRRRGSRRPGPASLPSLMMKTRITSPGSTTGFRELASSLMLRTGTPRSCATLLRLKSLVTILPFMRRASSMSFRSTSRTSGKSVSTICTCTLRHLLDLLQDVQAAPAAVALQRVRGVGHLLQLAQHELRAPPACPPGSPSRRCRRCARR